MPRRNDGDAQERQRQGGEADDRQRVETQRRADRDEEDDQDRRRAALHRRLQRVALSDRQVLDDQPRRHRGQQRLELLLAADLAQQRADGNQHETDLAPDVAQIQREAARRRDCRRRRRRRSPMRSARAC